MIVDVARRLVSAIETIVITALPMPSPCTTPPLFTEATSGALERHVTAVDTPDATVTRGVSVRSSPIVMIADVGDTETCGAALTVTCADERMVVSTVEMAMIVACPIASDATTPVAETVATDGLFERQVTVRGSGPSVTTSAIS